MKRLNYYSLSAAALYINPLYSQFLSLKSDAGVHFNDLTYEDDCSKPFALEGSGEQRLSKWSYNHRGFCEEFAFRGQGGAPRNRFGTKSVCLVCVRKHRLFNMTNPAPIQNYLTTRIQPVAVVEEQDTPQIMGRSLFQGASDEEYTGDDSFSFDNLDFANMDLSDFGDIAADLGVDLSEAISDEVPSQPVQVSSVVAPNLFKPESKICSYAKVTPYKSANKLCRGFLTRWTYNIEQSRCAATYFTGCYEEPNPEDPSDTSYRSEIDRNSFKSLNDCRNRCHGYTQSDKDAYDESLAAIEKFNVANNFARSAPGSNNSPFFGAFNNNDLPWVRANRQEAEIEDQDKYAAINALAAGSEVYIQGQNPALDSIFAKHFGDKDKEQDQFFKSQWNIPDGDFTYELGPDIKDPNDKTRCKFRPFAQGFCRSKNLRYSYNPDLNKCEAYYFGSCSGDSSRINKNIFVSEAFCNQLCVRSDAQLKFDSEEGDRKEAERLAEIEKARQMHQEAIDEANNNAAPSIMGRSMNFGGAPRRNGPRMNTFGTNQQFTYEDDPQYKKVNPFHTSFWNEESEQKLERMLNGLKGIEIALKTISGSENTASVCTESHSQAASSGGCAFGRPMPKWTFNAESNSCQTFIYAGCGGNSNRFGSKSDCENSCVSGSSNSNLNQEDAAVLKQAKIQAVIEAEREIKLEQDKKKCFSKPHQAVFVKDNFRCHMNEIKWVYRKQHGCQRIIFKGCYSGSPNIFNNIVECRQTCGKFRESYTSSWN